jgi:hypothetical protein
MTQIYDPVSRYTVETDTPWGPLDMGRLVAYTERKPVAGYLTAAHKDGDLRNWNRDNLHIQHHGGCPPVGMSAVLLDLDDVWLMGLPGWQQRAKDAAVVRVDRRTKSGKSRKSRTTRLSEMVMRHAGTYVHGAYIKHVNGNKSDCRRANLATAEVSHTRGTTATRVCSVRYVIPCDPGNPGPARAAFTARVLEYAAKLAQELRDG